MLYGATNPSFKKMKTEVGLFQENKDILQNIPGKDKTNVSEHITMMCANISHQIYDVKSKDDFKLKVEHETIENAVDGNVIIYDDRHDGPLNQSSPSFVAVATGDTLILG